MITSLRTYPRTVDVGSHSSAAARGRPREHGLIERWRKSCVRAADDQAQETREHLDRVFLSRQLNFMTLSSS